MFVRSAAVALLLVTCAGTVLAQDEMRTERVEFRKGDSGTTITDTIVGRESVSYVLGAGAGQTMTVALDPSNLATYFNVYAPGKGPGDEAIANSGVTGPPLVPDLNRFSATLPLSGEYTILVYMMRSAARRNERSDYTLKIAITGDDSTGVAEPPPATVEARSTASSEVSDAAQQACLSAVSNQTGEGDVAVLSTEFSEANSLVMVGVGAHRAPWRCLVSNDGSGAEVSFAGSEGAL